MKKLISIILTFALSFSTIYYAHCFAYKPTTAQSKTIHIKTSSLNETRNAVDKVYGSIPRKTSLFKKFLAVTFALGSAALITFAAFKKNITNLWNSSVDNDNSFNTNQDDNPLAEPNDDKPADQKTDSLDTSDSNNSNSFWQKLYNWLPLGIYLTSSSICTYKTGDPLTCLTTCGLYAFSHFNPTIEGLQNDISQQTTLDGFSAVLNKYKNFIISNDGPNLIFENLFRILPENSRPNFIDAFYAIDWMN